VPEGHTIHRAARRLRSILAGNRLERVEVRGQHLVAAKARERLLGATVTDVEARGKHLLVHVAAEDGLTIHSHLRMDGVWHLYRVRDPWKRARRRAWLVLGSGEWDAVNFDGPILGLHRTDELEHLVPSLAALGPDVLGDGFDEAEYLRRMRRDGDRELGDALLDQSIVAGIGNIYKSEALALTRTSPWRRVRDLDDATLLRVRETATRIMRDGVLDARAITWKGPGPAGQWAYGRAGRPCRSCRQPIASRPQGANQRTTYWCARCQS
jgi:endonuclease-8